jgi:hypothetical protein
MQAEPDLDAIERKALAALRKQLGVKARDLPRGMKRVGRRLPRDAHRAAEVISTAKAHLSYPKLGRMVDHHAVLTAEAVLYRHLDKIDPKERRKDAILSMLGAQAFNVIGVFVLVIALMAWRSLL